MPWFLPEFSEIAPKAFGNLSGMTPGWGKLEFMKKKSKIALGTTVYYASARTCSDKLSKPDVGQPRAKVRLPFTVFPDK